MSKRVRGRGDARRLRPFAVPKPSSSKNPQAPTLTKKGCRFLGGRLGPGLPKGCSFGGGRGAGLCFSLLPGSWFSVRDAREGGPKGSPFRGSRYLFPRSILQPRNRAGQKTGGGHGFGGKTGAGALSFWRHQFCSPETDQVSKRGVQILGGRGFVFRVSWRVAVFGGPVGGGGVLGCAGRKKKEKGVGEPSGPPFGYPHSK